MAKQKKAKGIPVFESEEDEARFWAEHSPEEFTDELEDVTDTFELSDELKSKIANRKPKRQLTIRLDSSQVNAAKAIAAQMGIGYQTLLRMWIVEGIRRDLKKAS